MDKKNSNLVIMYFVYILIYGAILGMHIYQNVPDTYWLFLALIGGILNAIKYVRLKIKVIRILIKLLTIETIGIICIVLIPELYKESINNFAQFNCMTILVVVLISIPIMIINRKIILANSDVK